MKPKGTFSVEDLFKVQRQERVNLIHGNSFKDQRIVFCLAHRGAREVVTKSICECGKEHESRRTVVTGLSPEVVLSWDRILKPMNHSCFKLWAVGHEVGEAYNQMIEQILRDPMLKTVPYILFHEDDVIAPFMPGTYGPLLELMKLMDNYDMASALYWTKSIPSLPLIYGVPGSNDFSPILDWKEGEVVPCNGMGMGFVLMKRSIFDDPRLKDTDGSWFKTVAEVKREGACQYTQDLWFYEKAYKFGYKACVHTGIRAGHYNAETGEIF